MFSIIHSVLVVSVLAIGDDDSARLKVIGPEGEPIPGAKVSVDGIELKPTDLSGTTSFNRITVKVSPPGTSSGTTRYQGQQFKIPSDLVLRLKPNVLSPQRPSPYPDLEPCALSDVTPSYYPCCNMTCSLDFNDMCCGLCIEECAADTSCIEDGATQPLPTGLYGTIQPESRATTGSGGAAKLTLAAPTDAVIFINGRPTTQTGTRREYVSQGLEVGHSYRYVVRAQVVRDGKVIEDTQEVVLAVGDTKTVAFDLSNGINSQLTKAR